MLQVSLAVLSVSAAWDDLPTVGSWHLCRGPARRPGACGAPVPAETPNCRALGLRLMSFFAPWRCAFFPRLSMADLGSANRASNDLAGAVFLVGFQRLDLGFTNLDQLC